MEFSAFFDKTINVEDNRLIYLKYFLFIKYDNKIYIEVKNVGDIIMPFKELLKNKLLKMYYDLSLLLVKDKNRFVEKISDKGRTLTWLICWLRTSNKFIIIKYNNISHLMYLEKY